MLISREIDYGLRILSRLSEERVFSVPELCELDSIPRQFAYKTIKKLEKAGYIAINRGVKGGCIIKCDLKKVSLYSLIISLNGSTLVNACMEDDYFCERVNKKCEACSIHCKLSSLQEDINNVLKSYSLYDLLR